MTTSSSTDFEPDVTEFIEEAFERCGLELRTGYDLKTAKRSINIMLAEWANRGLNQWTIEQTTQTVMVLRGAAGLEGPHARGIVDRQQVLRL